MDMDAPLKSGPAITVLGVVRLTHDERSGGFGSKTISIKDIERKQFSQIFRDSANLKTISIYATEDIGTTRSIAGLTVISPEDAIKGTLPTATFMDAPQGWTVSS
jgi:hypothetical protein